MNAPVLPYAACPLCGGANACGLASTGDPHAPCWCRDAAIDRATLARIPEALVGKACICPACARGDTTIGTQADTPAGRR